MARIKIEDLPKDMNLSQEELKAIYGGPTRRVDIYNLSLPTSTSQSLKELEGFSTEDLDI